jgi:hypothetical protein
MSLVKYLQRTIAPAQVPWMPQGDPELRYFINQLVLHEESDTVPGRDGNPGHASHFECYCSAMEEVGADASMALRFLDQVRQDGVDAALDSDLVPQAARHFSDTTFGLIRADKPHQVAAALALGRERVIPQMFRCLLREMGICKSQAPAFHDYLERHVAVDEDLHAPLSLKLLETLCAGDAQRIQEAEAAAEESICARIRFWDEVLAAIEENRRRTTAARSSSQGRLPV